MDPNMNKMLKWSIQNSNPETADASARGLNPDMLSSLLGGPTDADLMKASMAALHSPEVDLENKLVAFDNFEQLIENIDNANNMEPMGLWTPLVELLQHEASDMRRMAAWCVGTAVQNNEKAQDKVVVFNAVPKLVAIATSDADPAARKKSVYALSSAVRNYQPAMDELTKHLPESGQYPRGEKVDAGDMDAIDALMDKLRAHPVESSS